MTFSPPISSPELSSHSSSPPPSSPEPFLPHSSSQSPSGLRSASAPRRARTINKNLQRSFNRIGPFAVAPSTTRPPCVITILPAATSRRAAARAGSINPSQSTRASFPPTSFAASEGQIVLSRPRSRSSSRIAPSSAASASPGLLPRHPSEQYFTTSQSFSHFFRHSNERPQLWQFFVFFGVSPFPDPARLCTLSGIVSLYLQQ